MPLGLWRTLHFGVSLVGFWLDRNQRTWQAALIEDSILSEPVYGMSPAAIFKISRAYREAHDLEIELAGTELFKHCAAHF
jgi:hypothetical protein